MGRNTHLSKNTEEQIVALYAVDHLNAPAIARQLGTSSSYVYNVLDLRGMRVDGKRSPHADELADRLVAMYDVLELSKPTVKQALTEEQRNAIIEQLAVATEHDWGQIFTGLYQYQLKLQLAKLVETPLQEVV